mgnify:CR=1 FL=1
MEVSGNFLKLKPNYSGKSAEYRHSSISAVSIFAIFDLMRF